ncbi:unnamed protein product [Camellia sinensis]
MSSLRVPSAPHWQQSLRRHGRDRSEIRRSRSRSRVAHVDELASASPLALLFGGLGFSGGWRRGGNLQTAVDGDNDGWDGATSGGFKDGWLGSLEKPFNDLSVGLVAKLSSQLEDSRGASRRHSNSPATTLHLGVALRISGLILQRLNNNRRRNLRDSKFR